MTDAGWLVRSVVKGDQGALERGSKPQVEPDSSGQGQQPLRDPDPEAVDGVGAVAFQAELVFEGVEDRLSPSLGLARYHATGRPSGAASTYSLRPP
jgi:hypothetical protein